MSSPQAQISPELVNACIPIDILLMQVPKKLKIVVVFPNSSHYNPNQVDDQCQGLAQSLPAGRGRMPEVGVRVGGKEAARPRPSPLGEMYCRVRGATTEQAAHRNR